MRVFFKDLGDILYGTGLLITTLVVGFVGVGVGIYLLFYMARFLGIFAR